MKYDVTGKNLAKKIKKDGTISKVNDIAKTYKEGSIIVTFFGVFIAVLAYQIVHTSKSGKQYKQWIVQLKSEDGTIYEMKHTQAHSNKNMPKTAKIIQPSQPKIKIPEMKYQLCLPPARTAIDFIIENELNPLIKQLNKYIIDDISNYTKKTHVLKKCAKDRLIELHYFNNEDTFKERYCYIYELIYEVDEYPQILDKYKSIVKKCMIATHPDRTHENTSIIFNKFNELYKSIELPKTKPQPTTKKNSKKSNSSKKGRKVEMVDLDTGEVLKVFDCTGDANEYFGKRRSATSINNCILGKSKQAYGYKWRYAS